MLNANNIIFYVTLRMRLKISKADYVHSISWVKGEIPKEWSLANICPLFKKSDRSLACNYRPVSLTCIPCKLLEHIVCSNIMGHLDQYNLLSDKQHSVNGIVVKLS